MRRPRRCRGTRAGCGVRRDRLGRHRGEAEVATADVDVGSVDLEDHSATVAEGVEAADGAVSVHVGRFGSVRSHDRQIREGRSQPMSEQFVVSTEWLAEHIDDDDVRVLDVTGYLDEQRTNRAVDDYVAEHLPGAVWFDVASASGELSDPDSALSWTWPLRSPRSKRRWVVRESGTIRRWCWWRGRPIGHSASARCGAHERGGRSTTAVSSAPSSKAGSNAGAPKDVRRNRDRCRWRPRRSGVRTVAPRRSPTVAMSSRRWTTERAA